jgi:hypothetical protein
LCLLCLFVDLLTLVPIHHPAALDHGETSEQPRARVSPPKAHHVMRPAKAFVAARERLQIAALQHSITIEVRPDLLLAPTAAGREMREDIRRD